MERHPVHWNREYGPNEMETNGKLLMLTHVEYRNNKDLFLRKAQDFTVFTLNKISVILKCILTKHLKRPEYLGT